MVSKILHIFSGGLDSTVMLYYLLNQGNEVICVNFDYGSKHNEMENLAAKKICFDVLVELICVDITDIGAYLKSDLLKSGDDIPEGHYQSDNMKKTVVPFRNGIMLSIAAGIAKSYGMDAISIAVHTGDHTIYPDCRKNFMDSMHSAIRLGAGLTKGIRRDFTTFSKTTIVKVGSQQDVPFGDTWTCYKGIAPYHCGKCGACIERKEAFVNAGVKDPTLYKE